MAVKVFVESLEGGFTGEGDLELEIQFDNVARRVRTRYNFQDLTGEAVLLNEIKVSALDVCFNCMY